MIVKQYYINTVDIDVVCRDTGLAPDEVEALVGRFGKQSSRYGKLRGEVVLYVDGSVAIRKCFGKKTLWRQE